MSCLGQSPRPGGALTFLAVPTQSRGPGVELLSHETGEGGTGRPGAGRTPAKGRKAGEDEEGRKKLGGAIGNPGRSLGGDWEGEEDGDAERRPVEREKRGEDSHERSDQRGGWGSQLRALMREGPGGGAAGCG